MVFFSLTEFFFYSVEIDRHSFCKSSYILCVKALGLPLLIESPTKINLSKTNFMIIPTKFAFISVEFCCITMKHARSDNFLVIILPTNSHTSYCFTTSMDIHLETLSLSLFTLLTCAEIKTHTHDLTKYSIVMCCCCFFLLVLCE